MAFLPHCLASIEGDQQLLEVIRLCRSVRLWKVIDALIKNVGGRERREKK